MSLGSVSSARQGAASWRCCTQARFRCVATGGYLGHGGRLVRSSVAELRSAHWERCSHWRRTGLVQRVQVMRIDGRVSRVPGMWTASMSAVGCHKSGSILRKAGLRTLVEAPVKVLCTRVRRVWVSLLLASLKKGRHPGKRV